MQKYTRKLRNGLVLRTDQLNYVSCPIDFRWDSGLEYGLWLRRGPSEKIRLRSEKS